MKKINWLKRQFLFRTITKHHLSIPKGRCIVCNGRFYAEISFLNSHNFQAYGCAGYLNLTKQNVVGYYGSKFDTEVYKLTYNISPYNGTICDECIEYFKKKSAITFDHYYM